MYFRSNVTEITKLNNDWNLDGSLESFSIKAAIVLPPLLLQKLFKISKTREHVAALERRLTLWQDGNITEILDEAIAMQSRIPKQHNSPSLAKLIMEGKIKPALILLEDRSEGGVLEPISEVMKILNDKHPKAAYVNWNGVLNASNDLCSALALMSHKLCKTHTDSSSVEALLASRRVALEKCPGFRPIGIGEVMRRIVGKTVCRKFKTEMELSSGPLQLAAGQMSGIDAAIHSMRNFFNNSDRGGVLLVDAKNAFNLLNRRVALYNIQYSCPLCQHLPTIFTAIRTGFSSLVKNCPVKRERLREARLPWFSMASPLLCLSTLLL